jgi:predicted amidohydrolase
VNAPHLRIAAAQFPVFAATNWTEIAETLECWVAEAAGAGAQLLVFPEYAGMVTASLLPAAQRGQLSRELECAARHHAQWLALHARLAATYRVHLLAGSGPVQVADGHRNRAVLCAPNGNSGWQDKWTMTRFEAEQWGVSAGESLKVFETGIGRIGKIGRAHV